MRRIGLGLLLAAVSVALLGFWWINTSLNTSELEQPFSVRPGSSAREAAQAIAQVSASSTPKPVLATLLWAWFRASGQARQIKSGSYELEPGMSAADVLARLVKGDQSVLMVTFVEGWTFRQMRATLTKTASLRQTLTGLSNETVMAQLGRPDQHPEGRFFPDTYAYGKGSTDLDVLRRAMTAMDKRLAAAWATRDPKLPLGAPDDALILASIVEKETGKPTDRGQIAGVFANRLRIDMPLQTDPTVIYGLGERFDGNLRKRDLQADTPYNTYTRKGLPPTPIAMPGEAALQAAVRPQTTDALYFVARGDGTSQFSSNLSDHNRAVNKYQRGQ